MPMHPSTRVTLLHLFRALPFSISRRLQHRFAPKISDESGELYERAELRLAPNTVLRVPRSRDTMYDQIALFGLYEERLSRICRQAGKRGGLMVDVGANVGYFTALFLAQNPENRVLAIEPSPRMREVLVGNLRTNDFADRTTVESVAASASRETRTFVEPVDLTGWGKFGERDFGAAAHRYEVRCMPLDEMIAPSERVRFLKIDVEGAELMVLQGANRLLQSRQIETLYVEVNKPGAQAMGLAPDAVLHFLRTRGYATSRLGPAKPIEDWIARPSR